MGAASDDVMNLTRRTNCSSCVGYSGVPWSGHAVNWNWRTSRFSAPPFCHTHTHTHTCSFNPALPSQSHTQGRTAPPGCLALGRWAGWSAGQVGRHVKYWRREWNEGGGPGPLANQGGLSADKLIAGPRVPSYATARGAGRPNWPGPVSRASQSLLTQQGLLIRPDLYNCMDTQTIQPSPLL